ncbi:coilin [Dendrobium catenatum]|uniref:coilin n=1 Tax=Dendrobium catenatum TaxID=906689 RepID=UPI0009F21B67|nr:coilin [Dendrobium catenatum]
MGKDKEGMVRFRVFFDNHRLLNNSQLSDGLGRCWLLLKPSIVTFADLVSHLREKFALRNRQIRLVLLIDDFVLPPFESTGILKDKDLIRVKLKNVKLKDALLPCHSQNIVQDPQIARSHGFSSDNNTMEDEKSQANSQGNVNNENAVHDGNLSLGIGVLKQKRRHSLEFHNSMRKRQKPNCAEKQFTKAGVQDVHSRQNTTLCHVSSDSKMKLPAQDYTHDDGLVVSLPVSEITLGEPSSSMSSKERQQSEGINNVLESEPHITCDATKKFAQSSSATSNNDQNQGRNSCRSVHEKKSENHAWIDRKPGGDSPDLKAKTTVEHKIDFATLFPLTRSPLKGDILAYRYVEPSSTVYPVLSSPQVGKVSAFDYKSSEIVLIPAPEFEIFSEENPMSPTSLRAASPYKEDGSLQIKLSALIDVRLLKAHNSKELACLPEGTFNRTKKDKSDVAVAKSTWNHSSVHRTGSSNGTKPTSNDRRASASWLYGASPAAALFWETVGSKGSFGKGGKCSSSGKY